MRGNYGRAASQHWFFVFSLFSAFAIESRTTGDAKISSYKKILQLVYDFLGDANET